MTTHGGFEFVFSSPIDGAALSNGSVVAYFSSGLFALELEILWYRRNDCARKYAAVFADARTIHDRYIRSNPSAFSDFYIAGYGCESANFNVATDSGIWVDLI
jgi:hypothetical protein